MPNQWDYYSMVGFAPETNAPDELERLSFNADKTAVFLDFDGTLVDIAPSPDAIVVDGEVKTLLGNLVQQCDSAVAIVSGRNLQEIDRYLGDFAGAVSGGHGAELRHVSGHFDGIDCDLARLTHIKNAVKEFAVLNPMVIAEEKVHGVVLHFRQYPEIECKVREFLTSLIGDDTQFEIQAAKMAVEVKPKGTSKAHAIERIMRFEKFAGRGIFFAGDDVTDEGAFCWVNDQGGTTVKIGDGPTCARYRTQTPSTFKHWLSSQVLAGRR
jgi:trehalose 6-phosphate phosphatase